MTLPTPFLFSVDVEEPHVRGSRNAMPLADLVGMYLDFLAQAGGRGTFFFVGEVARNHPHLVARVAAAGHEVACHSDRHIPLDRLGPQGFRNDLRQNLAALQDAGAAHVIGYRAPCFSLTEASCWAYEILAEHGLRYSSSVLPARSPLYGWPEFGRAPKWIDGILELPVSLLTLRFMQFPAAGGVYFRIMPWPIIDRALRQLNEKGRPVVGYFHPYDLDTAQTLGAFPGFSRYSPANWILFANRAATLRRLRKLVARGFTLEAFRSQIDASR